MQALRETSVPEKAMYLPPADPEYAKTDVALCQRMTNIVPVAFDAKAGLEALLECSSHSTAVKSAPGPTIHDYHEAYRRVRDELMCRLAPRWLRTDGQ
jgi:hypothetical protein